MEPTENTFSFSFNDHGENLLLMSNKSNKSNNRILSTYSTYSMGGSAVISLEGWVKTQNHTSIRTEHPVEFLWGSFFRGEG